MEKIKFLLALSPVAAISMASVFLQGYWGRFGISPFPFLSVQELIIYSAVPFFGVALIIILGAFLGYLDYKLSETDGTKSSSPKWLVWTQHSIMIAIGIALAYFSRPYIWVLLALFLSNFTPELIKLAGFKERIEERWSGGGFLICIGIILLVVSAGYGMTYADLIKEDNKANVKIIHGMGADEARFLGKLGGYVFIISSDGKVIQLPADSIKRIEYIGEARSL